MINEQLRERIWDGLLDSERYSLYYKEQADKYRLWHKTIRFLSLFLILIEAITIPLFSSEPYSAYIVIALGAVIVALVVFEAVTDYSENVAVLDWASADFGSLHTRWDELWLDVETDFVDDASARKRRRKLIANAQDIGRRISISENKKLTAKTEERADKVIGDKYA